MRQIILKGRPDGMPSLDTFQFINEDVPDRNQDEVLLKTLYLSVDPYMRGRMSDEPSYVKPFEVGKPLNGRIIAQVIESKVDKLKEGDIVTGIFPWQEYIVAFPNELRRLDVHELPISSALGVLGTPGLTAYFGMYHIGEPKEGETVVVSSAAGAVGSIAGQLAQKRGARVVGIVGSRTKADYIIETLGFDDAVNYKNEDVGKGLKTKCPDGIDVYFENVGGEISDDVWPLLNTFARVPLCGAISAYNLASDEEDIGTRVQWPFLKARIKMQGFIVGDYSEHFSDAYKELTQLVKKDELHFEETILEGFDRVPEAFIGLFSGDNIGKQLVKVAEPDK
ncbi:NADP-dependent oxidoreductase [Salicibibacter cibarius]|uniref:NADP-dependent oxidoreductase n=1 Tax=Salicibibacter cibarius TaxID=2743000 RepID=A0A7T7CD92_9BACI|nr:NADP-dependent oxidoreductase [Salicibibacter cibarius]QQK77764.1 NADP-dependent oxidoreductase [Salicibibacter cibarius]